MEDQSVSIIYAKNVKVQNVLKNYMNGKFINIGELTPIKKPVNDIIGKKHGSSGYDETYRYIDKNNNNITIQTSNHNNFQLFNENGQTPKRGGICDYCKCQFDSYCLGYPVSFHETNVTFEGRIHVFYIFNMKGEFCTFECTKAYIELLNGNTSCVIRNEISTSLQGLLFLYKIIHGNKPLRSANDRYLLKENGGTLTREEWLNHNSLYIPTNRVVCAPVKSEYIIQNLNNRN